MLSRKHTQITDHLKTYIYLSSDKFNTINKKTIPNKLISCKKNLKQIRHRCLARIPLEFDSTSLINYDIFLVSESR